MSASDTESTGSIWIVSALPPTPPYTPTGGSQGQLTFRERVDIAELQHLLAQFTRDLTSSFDAIAKFAGEYTVDTIEVSAIMAADGKIGLLGSSLGAKTEGGIKFTFKRRSAQPVSP